MLRAFSDWPVCDTFAYLNVQAQINTQGGQKLQNYRLRPRSSEARCMHFGHILTR